jgi:hypothetical protein
MRPPQFLCFELEHPSHWPCRIPPNVAVPVRALVVVVAYVCVCWRRLSRKSIHRFHRRSIEITIIHGNWGGTTTERLDSYKIFIFFFFLFLKYFPQVRA